MNLSSMALPLTGTPPETRVTANGLPRLRIEIIGFEAGLRHALAQFLDSLTPTCQLVANGETADLYLVDADSVHSLVELDFRRPDNTRPAILIGAAHPNMVWPFLSPLTWRAELPGTLERLQARALALQALEASTPRPAQRWPYVDRRNKARLDLDLSPQPALDQQRDLSVDNSSSDNSSVDHSPTNNLPAQPLSPDHLSADH